MLCDVKITGVSDSNPRHADPKASVWFRSDPAVSAVIPQSSDCIAAVTDKISRRQRQRLKEIKFSDLFQFVNLLATFMMRMMTLFDEFVINQSSKCRMLELDEFNAEQCQMSMRLPLK